MKRVIWVLVFLCGCSSTPSDARFSPPDKSFKIYFPAKPAHESTKTDSSPVRTESHSFFVRRSDAQFMLNYLELIPAPGDLKATDALEATLAAAMQKNQGVGLTKQSSIIGGYPTMTVQMRCRNGAVLDGRFIYVSPRIYQVMVIHPADKEPAEMKRFFESFAVNE